MRFAWALPALLSACAGVHPPPSPPSGAPAFDPLAFFAGRTEGTGTVHVILSRARSVHVHGLGTFDADGSMRLVQQVKVEGKAATRREWLMRRVAPGRYVGSLSDARGPVAVDVDGGGARIRFRMTHGLSVQQHIVPEPGGQAARNRMTVRALGVVVAELNERIVRDGGGEAR